MKLCIFLTVLLILTLKLQPSNSFQVIYAVNVGGEQHTTANGMTYEKDPGGPGYIADHGTIGGIPYDEGVIYKTLKHLDDPITYQVPVVGDGKYLIIFKFHEVLDPSLARGKDRKINIDANNIRIVDQLNLYRDHGAKVPVEIHRHVTVKQGRVHHGGQSAPINYNKIGVKFSRAAPHNHMVCGILFVKLEDDEDFPEKSWLASPSNKAPMQCLTEKPSATGETCDRKIVQWMDREDSLRKQQLDLCNEKVQAMNQQDSINNENLNLCSKNLRELVRRDELNTQSTFDESRPRATQSTTLRRYLENNAT
jgi:hypothetical protein